VRRRVALFAGPQRSAFLSSFFAVRLDIAARVDGRVAEIPVERGQNVVVGAVLVKIDNPETLAKNEQGLAAADMQAVASHQGSSWSHGANGGGCCTTARR
jgi:multidrug efflux pump subunit AcrA (membrane-fusion protein)